jgi:signal transduction histidine kinase
VLADVERLKPTRVVFDSLSEMRLLAGSALRYRRQILALKQFFVSRQCTVLLLDNLTGTDQDLQSASSRTGAAARADAAAVRRPAPASASAEVPRRPVPRRLSGHQVVLELGTPRLVVRGDAVRLTQIIVNLLTNAAKYTNAGGRIHISVERRGDSAVLAVRDTGIGIAPAHLASVFEMFMQVDRSNRRAQGGLGIGLTLVRTLVELHGGQVEARSDGIGTGSTFVVTLPALHDMVADAEAGASPRAFPSVASWWWTTTATPAPPDSITTS